MRHSNAQSTSRSVQNETSGYYEWRVPGHPLAVLLNLAVIDRLEADIMKGFWAVPKRGMEVGGILTGRIEAGEETVVVVDDYEAVSCEHRRGPSYVLSEPDRKRLEKVLRHGGSKQVVGFYRSHTRLGLYLDQDDMAVIDGYFGNPSQVFLLVRPDATKPGAAGFFFREEGEMHRQSTFLEFPFSRAEILKQSGAIVEEREQAPAVPAASPALAPPPVPAEPRRPRPRVLPQVPARIRQLRWKTTGAVAAGIIAFSALEYQVVAYFRRPPAISRDYVPSLSVEPSGAYLQVTWNRNAAAVLNAERGVLSISDGGFRKDLKLDEQQLRTGAVVYAPKGNEVNFRLDLMGGRTTVSESLRFLSATPVAPPAPVQTAAVTEVKQPEPPSPEPVEAKAKPRRRVFFDDGL